MSFKITGNDSDDGSVPFTNSETFLSSIRNCLKV